MTQHRTPRTWRPLLSSAALYSTAGAISALLGWALLEPFFQEGGTSGARRPRKRLYFSSDRGRGFRISCSSEQICFSTILGGNHVGCRQLRLSFCRRLSCACSIPGRVQLVQPPPQPGPVMDQTTAFVATLAGRTLAWSLIGTIVGLGTSLVIGNRGRLLDGILGGLLGGLMAGVLFDPIQVLMSGADKSPWISRMAGFIILGGMTGFLIGLMEDASCRGVLLITSGPRAGTRLVLDSKPCLVGSATACDIVLPAAPEIGPSAGAVVQRIGLSFELKALGQEAMVQVNRRPISRTCLTHGDCIRIGGTDLLFSDPGRNKT